MSEEEETVEVVAPKGRGRGRGGGVPILPTGKSIICKLTRSNRKN